MIRQQKLTPSFTFALVAGTTLTFLAVDLTLHDNVREIFKEGHTIELMSAVLPIATALLWFAAGADDRQGRQWHLPVILLLMALREMDMDKRLTSEGILQLRLYSGPSPLVEKLAGLAIVALILICGWRLLRNTVPRMLAGLRAGRAASWLSLLAGISIVVAKTLDGADRKLAAFGITLDPALGVAFGRVEEALELAAMVMLLQALVYFLRDQARRQASALRSTSATRSLQGRAPSKTSDSGTHAASSASSAAAG